MEIKRCITIFYIVFNQILPPQCSKMEQSIRKMYRVYDQASSFLAREGKEIDTGRLEKLLAHIYSPGPSYQFILDFSTSLSTLSAKALGKFRVKILLSFPLSTYLDAFIPGIVITLCALRENSQ